MLMHNEHPPGMEYIPIKYQFLAPARLRIQKPDGTTDLVGFGIGETIDVMEPAIQYLIPPHRYRETIPLPGGAQIIDPPSHVNVKIVNW